MTISINTNIVSLKSQKNLEKSKNKLEISLSRLSSGLRINQAKDDAAGLITASRFTNQIQGMNQAIRNSNDGISMLQVGEGALNEIAASLQRIRELSVESVNDTNHTSDRQEMQKEVDQLIEEIDHISKTTEFNGQKLFDSDDTSYRMSLNKIMNDPISATLYQLKTGWLKEAEKVISKYYGLEADDAMIRIAVTGF